MAWRIFGGLGGWLASLAPLVIVNALALITAIGPGDLPIAGGAALIVGIALGGLIAGLLGGKRGDWGGAVAGAIAAALFAATLIGMMYVLRAQHQLPYLLELHPVRTMGAIGFVACLVLAVAAGVGAVTSSRQARIAAERTPARPPARPSGQRPPGPVSPPYTRPGENGRPPRESARYSRPPQPTPPGQRAPRDSRSRAKESDTRERSSRW